MVHAGFAVWAPVWIGVGSGVLANAWGVCQQKQLWRGGMPDRHLARGSTGRRLPARGWRPSQRWPRWVAGCSRGSADPRSTMGACGLSAAAGQSRAASRKVLDGWEAAVEIRSGMRGPRQGCGAPRGRFVWQACGASGPLCRERTASGYRIGQMDPGGIGHEQEGVWRPGSPFLGKGAGRSIARRSGGGFRMLGTAAAHVRHPAGEARMPARHL